MVAVNSLMKAGFALVLLTFILQSLGYSCPGWLIVVIDLGAFTGGDHSVSSQTAIWYVNLCYKDNTLGIDDCSLHSLHDPESQEVDEYNTSLQALADINWITLEVQTTIALLACLIGLGLAIAGMCNQKKCPAKVLSAIACCVMFISGGTVAAAVIKVGTSLSEANNAANLLNLFMGQDVITLGAPWALILDAVSIVTAFLAGILLILLACKQNESTSGVVFPNHMRMAPTSYGQPGYGQGANQTGFQPGYGNPPGYAPYGANPSTTGPEGARPDGLYATAPPPYPNPYPTKA